jgi:putative PIN family toxin of toxin-antitoxin system
MSPRVVVDTNIVIAGLQSKLGASFQVLRLLGTKSVQHTVSNALIYEYEEVINRLRDKGQLQLSEQAIETFMTFIVQQAHHQSIYVRLRPQLNDPKDEHVLELAFNAGCQHIITFNIKDFKPAWQFGISAIRPSEFLQFIGGITHVSIQS